MALDNQRFNFDGSDLDVHAIKSVIGSKYVLANPFAISLGYDARNLNHAITYNVDPKNIKTLGEIIGEYEMSDEEIPNVTLGGPGCKIQMRSKFINEAGLNELIMNSSTPRAKEFRQWVNGEVLPTLCKTGKYEMNMAPQEQQDQMNAINQVFHNEPATWYMEKIALMEQISRKNEELLLQKDKIIAMQPYVVDIPKDPKKYHVLGIYQFDCIDGYGYIAIRTQKKSMNKALSRILKSTSLPNVKPLCRINSPNAINAFNRIKENIDCKTRFNRVYCNIPPEEFLKKIVH